MIRVWREGRSCGFYIGRGGRLLSIAWTPDRVQHTDGRRLLISILRHNLYSGAWQYWRDDKPRRIRDEPLRAYRMRLRSLIS